MIEATASEHLSRAPVRRPLQRGDLQIGGRFGVIFVWIAMAVAFSIASPGLFLRPGTLQAILAGQQPLVFLALSLVVVLAVGEFDLSVASVLGLSATIVAQLIVVLHVPPVLAVLAGAGAALVVGLVNGYLVVYRRIDPIVVTLGMGTLLTGLALWMTNLSSVVGLPDSMAAISNTQILYLPISFYYGLVLVIVATYVMFATRLGRHMLFVGANREVSRLAGIRVNGIRVGAYVVSALIAGVGGIVLVAGLGGYDPSTSNNYLLPAFAAAFLGSAMLVPGRFNPLGAFLGIYFLQTGIVGLQLLGLTGWISDVFFGASLIIAVAVSQWMRRKALS